MRTIPKVKQIVKVYEAGVTTPLLCMIEPNDTLVVVKYPFNPFGNHVLVNEWIAHSIARAISAPIPPFVNANNYKIFSDCNCCPN